MRADKRKGRRNNGRRESLMFDKSLKVPVWNYLKGGWRDSQTLLGSTGYVVTCLQVISQLFPDVHLVA